MALHIPVIVGSVRSDRLGIRPARYLVNKLTALGHDAPLIDPKTEYELPLLDKMYKEYEPGQAPPTLEKLGQIIKAADAYLIVTAEYNHSAPPALVNLLDHFLDEYYFKPSAIACYSVGRFGGVRAAVALRPMLAEMGMSSIPSLLPFPNVHDAVAEDGTLINERMEKSTDRFLTDLEWYANALKDARANGTPY